MKFSFFLIWYEILVPFTICSLQLNYLRAQERFLATFALSTPGPEKRLKWVNDSLCCRHLAHNVCQQPTGAVSCHCFGIAQYFCECEKGVHMFLETSQCKQLVLALLAKFTLEVLMPDSSFFAMPDFYSLFTSLFKPYTISVLTQFRPGKYRGKQSY